jgi:uncharacterized protein (DUF2236 family)
MPDAAAEAVLIAGGGRTILLQLANPGVGRGVAEHSDFASRPLDRLHATLTYVYAVAFGSPAEAAFVRQRVNRAHVPVHSEPGSARYTAFDPQLQLWVAATLYDSAMTVHRHVFGPADDVLADRLYAAYADLGTALQVPVGLWPPNRTAFERYWAEQVAQLRTDAATRRVADQLLRPPIGPLPLRAVMPLARLLTLGLLPPAVRELFGFGWTGRQQWLFNAVMAVLRRVYPRLPRRIRQWPKRHYLRVLRRQMLAEARP